MAFLLPFTKVYIFSIEIIKGHLMIIAIEVPIRHNLSTIVMIPVTPKGIKKN